MARKSGLDMSGTDDLFATGSKEEPGNKGTSKPRKKAPQPKQEDQAPARDTFTKYTFPITGTLRERLDDTLRDVAYHQRCEIPKSLLIRYALAQVLDQLRDDRDATLLALAHLQEAEIQVAGKYNPDRGLQELLNKNSEE